MSGKNMPFNYIIKRSAKRKTMSISIKDGQVIVSAPIRATFSQIEKMVNEHSSWIEKKLSDPRKNVNFDLTKDDSVYILGQKYPIRIVTETKNNIYISGGILHLEGKSINSISTNLKKYLIEIVGLYVVNIKEELGIDFEVNYKHFKTKWGCCYKSQRKIVLNYLCGCLPKEALKQVIYHEIAHFKVSNHQKSFYQYLGQLYPDYKQQVKVLKEYTIQ